MTTTSQNKYRKTAGQRWYNHLSIKLMWWVLLTSMSVGLLLSCIQVAVEAATVKEHLDADIQESLATMRHSASQAVYSIDPVLSRQVLEGLLTIEAVIAADISHPNGMVMAEVSRPLVVSPLRFMTDLLFDQVRNYSLALYMSTPEPTYYGELKVSIDTYYAAQRFLKRALVTFIAGISSAMILACVLYLTYHVFLTSPIKQIIDSILRINPAEPGLQSVPVPHLHEDDELGTLVKATNELLNAIESHQNRQEEAEERVIKLSQFDMLTGLPNRTLFRSYLQGAIDEATLTDQKLAVFCIGIDDFTSINDQHGYSIGDAVLQAFAERLKAYKDSVHASCRLAGDQFALIQFNVLSPLRVASFAEKLLKELARPFEIRDHVIVLNATIGIALFPDDGRDPEKLLQQTEQTMTLAKNSSHNQFHFYVASIDAEIRERKQLEKDLALAIGKNELFLVYQPQITMDTFEVDCVEALLRWKHPIRGLIPPDVFIPVAESNDSIIELGYWIITEVCRQLKRWQTESDFRPTVAVNISARQIYQTDFVKRVLDIIRLHRVDPALLEFEITETSFMGDLDLAVTTLRALSDTGIRCAVDDFGTGFSSLSYLKQLPIHKLKIDKQFIRDLMGDSDDTRIVHAIIQLGSSLRLVVIAEGVESQVQVDFLLKEGCRLGQGYLFSKPIAPDEIIDFVRIPLKTTN
jgi:diguanylate cyclase (GGDEF)-like protein